MEQSEIDRERVAGAYRDSIIASVEHDNDSIHVPNTRFGAEAYQEEGRRLDGEEASFKEQYTQSGCEEQTGLSADAFRHQTIEDYTHEQMASQEQDAASAQSYWNANNGAVAGENTQEVNNQNWDSQSLSENGNSGIVIEDGASHQASSSSECSEMSNTGASTDNSVSNENSL